MSNSKELIRRDNKVISDVMKLRFYPINAKYTEGLKVIDEEGKEYLDFSAGWGVANVGYGHPDIIRAVTAQMEKNSFTGTISVVNEESVLLAEELIKLLPGTFLKKVWYGHSGSDANEFVAKLVGEATGRSKIMTFVGSYHGQTMGAYTMSGHPAQGKFIGGGNVLKAPYPYCYRCAFGKEQSSCKLFCADYLDEYLLRYAWNPNQIGAVVIEAIQCDGGDIVPPSGFLRRIDASCKANGMLLILDEVKIGFGRTGHMFGFEAEGIVPDAVIVAKPMASGLPLSAVIGRCELMDAGAALHMFTTAGSPVSCKVALETLRIIRDEKLMENAGAMGEYLIEKLQVLKGKYGEIGDIRGRGLVVGLDMVVNSKSKKEAGKLAAHVIYGAYERGLLCFCAGIHSNVLEFTPPLIVNKKDIDKAVDILDNAIEDAMKGRVDSDKVKAYAGWNS